MTDKKPEALRLADEFDATKSYLGSKAAAELRRLHEVNAELVEALREAKESIMDWGAYAGEYFQNKYDLDGDIAKVEAALAKAEGK